MRTPENSHFSGVSFLSYYSAFGILSSNIEVSVNPLFFAIFAFMAYKVMTTAALKELNSNCERVPASKAIEIMMAAMATKKQLLNMDRPTCSV